MLLDEARSYNPIDVAALSTMAIVYRKLNLGAYSVKHGALKQGNSLRHPQTQRPLCMPMPIVYRKLNLAVSAIARLQFYALPPFIES